MTTANPYATPTSDGSEAQYDWTLAKRIFLTISGIVGTIGFFSTLILWQFFEQSALYKASRQQDPDWLLQQLSKFFLGS